MNGISFIKNTSKKRQRKNNFNSLITLIPNLTDIIF